MDNEEACEVYWKAVKMIQEIINSGHMDSKDYVLQRLEDDLT